MFCNTAESYIIFSGTYKYFHLLEIVLKICNQINHKAKQIYYLFWYSLWQWHVAKLNVIVGKQKSCAHGYYIYVSTNASIGAIVDLCKSSYHFITLINMQLLLRIMMI